MSGFPRLRSATPPSAGALLLSLFLLPARNSTLRGDDTWTFQRTGLRQLVGTGFLESLGAAVTSGLRQGRPQFLGGLQGEFVIWAFADHRTTYHLFLILLTVVAAILLYRLVQLLGAPWPVALLVLVLLAGAIQFRAYHDAVLGYYGFLQLALILLLGSLLTFVKALRTGERRYLVAAVLLFVLMAACYEATYPLAGAHLVVALTERRKRAAVRAAMPFLVASALFTAESFLTRQISTTELSGYDASFRIGAVIRSFVVQLVPPLPASNMLFEPGIGTFFGLGSSPTPAEVAGAVWRGAVVFAAVVGVGLWIGRHSLSRYETPGAALGRMAAVGIALWVLPVGLLALAPKYQVETQLGKGYLPVLVQSFGYAMVAAALIGAVAIAAGRRSLRAVVAGVLGLACVVGYGAAVTGFNNLRVIAMEQPVNAARDLLQTAAARQVFATLPARASLLFTGHDTEWWSGSWRFGPATVESMLVRASGRVFDGRIAADLSPASCGVQPPDPLPADCEPLNSQAAWVRFHAFPGGGTVVLAPFRGRDLAAAQNQTADRLRVYTQLAGGPPRPPSLIGATSDGQAWRSSRLAWRSVKRGRGWALYEATIGEPHPVAASLMDIRNRIDFLNRPAPDDTVRIYGAGDLLP